MSSTLRVNSLTNADGTGAVNFPHGITGDGSGLDFNPEVIGFNPDLFKSGVAVDTNITISFNQNIQFFGTGTVEIRQGSSSGSIVESFAITSGSPASGLSIVNSQLIINPTADLAINTTFYIILPSQGISNTSEVFYAGSNHYAFTTINQTFSMSGGNHEFISANPSSPTGFYKYHIFTGTSAISLSAPSANATDFTSLFVAGGGGGGGYPGSYRAGGGGGAGGLLKRTGPQLGIPAGNYTVVVGAGGEGMGWNPTNTNGQDTVISPPASPTTYLIRAVGGGAGGYPANNNPPYKGNPGGSGGGAYSEATPNSSTMPSLSQGGSSFPGQGNPGGGNMFYSGPGYCQVGGGGGGAGAPGTRGFTDTNSYPNSNYWYGGTGGAGMQVSEFPFTEIFSPGVIPESDFPSDTLERSENGYFAGGGGGGASPPPSNHYRGQGGIGGGGTGSGNTAPVPVGPPVYTTYPGHPSPNYAQDGAARLGGGGGGGRNSVPSYRGGRGGSGVAMIRYAYPAALV